MFAGFLVIGAAFAVWWWPVQGARRVEQLKAELRGRGERFSYEELGSAPVGGSESVNVLLRSLAARLEALGQGDRSKPVERGAEGEPRVEWLENRLHSCRGFQVDWEMAEAIIDELGHGWTELENALRDPPANAGLGYSQDGTGNTSRRAIVNVARGLRDRVIVEMHRGRREEAFGALVTLIRCARYNREGQMLLEQLHRMMVLTLARNVLWQMLQDRPWSETELRLIQDEWEQVDIVAAIPAGLEIDRIQSLATLEALREGAYPLPRASGVYAAPCPTDWKQRLRLTSWRWFQSHRAEVNLINDLQVVLDQARAVAMGRPVLLIGPGQPRHQVLGPNGWHDCWIRSAGSAPLARTFHACSTSQSRVLDLVVWREAERRLATAALAIERYHVVNGMYPMDLKDLVPKYLTNVPLSPFDGRPVRYRIRSDGRFLLAAPELGSFAQPPSEHDALWLAPEKEKVVAHGTLSEPDEVLPLIQFDSAPLGDVMAVLIRQSGLPVSPAPGVTYDGRPPVTLRLHNVTLLRFLEVVMNWAELKLIQDRFTEQYWVVNRAGG